MTLEARVTAPVVRPVIVGLLDFKDDPAMGWTGPGVFAPTGTGDPDLDGNMFSPVESATVVSGFASSSSGTRPVMLTFSAHDNAAEAMRQIVRDNRIWRLRKAKLWLFFLSDDEKTVHPEFKQLFSGVIAGAKTDRGFGRGATIELTLDADLQAARGAPSRLADHVRFNPGDAAGTFMDDLAKGKIAGGAPTNAGNGGPGRGGGGGGNPSDNIIFRIR